MLIFSAVRHANLELFWVFEGIEKELPEWVSYPDPELRNDTFQNTLTEYQHVALAGTFKHNNAWQVNERTPAKAKKGGSHETQDPAVGTATSRSVE